MLKILNSRPVKTLVALIPLLIWEGADAQSGNNADVDEDIVFQLVKAETSDEHYSDEFIVSAIKVTERRSDPNLLAYLVNLSLSTRISAESKKRIKDFLHQQIGSLQPSMRTEAVYTMSFLDKEDSVPMLLKAIEDENQSVRIAALSQLRVYANPNNIQTIEELLQKRRAAPGIDNKDATLIFGAGVVEILRQLDGGFDDPSRFDDGTLIGVVLPRALRQNDHYSDALVQRVIDTLKKKRGLAAKNLLVTLSRFTEGNKISRESRERIAKAIAEEAYRANEHLKKVD